MNAPETFLRALSRVLPARCGSSITRTRQALRTPHIVGGKGRMPLRLAPVDPDRGRARHPVHRRNHGGVLGLRRLPTATIIFHGGPQRLERPPRPLDGSLTVCRPKRNETVKALGRAVFNYQFVVHRPRTIALLGAPYKGNGPAEAGPFSGRR